MKKSMLKRIISMFLIAAFLLTIVPVPVKAVSNTRTIKYGGKRAVINVKPGDSITLKLGNRDCYTRIKSKPITWSSSKESVATVDKNGKVTAKAYGKTTIKAKMAVKWVGKPGWTTLGATKTTSVYSCTICVVPIYNLDKNEITPEEMDRLLNSNGYDEFYLTASGTRKQAAAKIKELQEAVGKVNTYGVQFQYGLALEEEQHPESIYMGYQRVLEPYDCIRKNDDNLWQVAITRDACNLYRYTVAFMKQLLQVAHHNLTYCYTQGSNLCNPELAEERVRLLDEVNYCDMSEALRFWYIDIAGYFAGIDRESKDIFTECFHECGYDGEYLAMRYTHKKTVDDWPMRSLEGCTSTMKLMLENRADGVCQQIAWCEVILFTQLGIRAQYEHDYIHAWSGLYLTNGDGTEMYVQFDYTTGGGLDKIIY